MFEFLVSHPKTPGGGPWHQDRRKPCTVSPPQPFQHPSEHKTDIQVCGGLSRQQVFSGSTKLRKEALCRPTGSLIAGAAKPCAVSRSWPPAQESSTCYISTEPPPEPACETTACRQHWPSPGTHPNCAHGICICWAVLARSHIRSVGSG